MTLTLLLDQAAILAIVSVLGCVQTPIYLLRRLLSRQAIFLAPMAIIVVISAAAIVNRELTSAAFSLGAAVATFGFHLRCSAWHIGLET